MLLGVRRKQQWESVIECTCEQYCVPPCSSIFSINTSSYQHYHEQCHNSNAKAHTNYARNTINALREKMQSNQEIKLQLIQSSPSNKHKHTPLLQLTSESLPINKACIFPFPKHVLVIMIHDMDLLTSSSVHPQILSSLSALITGLALAIALRPTV